MHFGTISVFSCTTVCPYLAFDAMSKLKREGVVKDRSLTEEQVCYFDFNIFRKFNHS